MISLRTYALPQFGIRLLLVINLLVFTLGFSFLSADAQTHEAQKEMSQSLDHDLFTWSPQQLDKWLNPLLAKSLKLTSNQKILSFITAPTHGRLDPSQHDPWRKPTDAAAQFLSNIQ